MSLVCQERVAKLIVIQKLREFLEFRNTLDFKDKRKSQILEIRECICARTTMKVYSSRVPSIFIVIL
jgi:hypothetical protein